MTQDILRLAAVTAAVCFALAVFATTGLELSLDVPAGLISLRAADGGVDRGNTIQVERLRHDSRMPAQAGPGWSGPATG